MKELNSKLLSALESKNPEDSLISIVDELKLRGLSQKEVYDLFHSFYVNIKDKEPEEKLDILCDVLDCISGWCSPDKSLFDGYLNS